MLACMLCRTTNPDKIVAMASLLILGAVLPLAGALLVQYVGQKPPCHFCLLQRYPYMVVFLAGGVLLGVKRMGRSWRLSVAFGILGLLTTGILGLIHTGIESGYLHYSGGCVAQAAKGMSLEALRAAIHAAPLVACNNVMAAFHGAVDGDVE